METLTTDYIKGWADRHCQVNVPGRSITLTSIDGKAIRSVYASLKSIGIECSVTSRDVSRRDKDGNSKPECRYELRVGRRAALSLWREVIGFHDKQKSSRLDDILSSYTE